ncbi:MAG: squalene/phytoene synthase family protein [Thermoguttaceae bacterium]
MNRHAIDASYAHCRRLSRQAGSSFHAGFLLLPRSQRKAMWALYAFMRHTDDLADNPLEAPSRRESLDRWRSELEEALGGNAHVVADETPGSPGDLILPALADTVRQFNIPHEHLFAAIDGVAMDIDGRRYETFDELQQYCERVASAVGLCCIHIWGFRGDEAFEPARQAGIALQLTNILRDVKEDAALGRIYLPTEDLQRFNCSPDALPRGVADRPFRELMAFEVARAERAYAEAAELIDWLAPSGRRIFGALMATYHCLLREIARRPDVVLRRRVQVGRLWKLLLLARWAVLPPRKDSLR